MYFTFQIELQFRSVGFQGDGKTGVPGEKPLGARTRTNNKLARFIGRSDKAYKLLSSPFLDSLASRKRTARRDWSEEK